MAEGRHLFVDPSLSGNGGHNLALARTYAARVGADRLWCAISRHADPELDVPARRVLRTFHYTATEASRVRRYGRVASTIGVFARNLRRRLVRDGGSGSERRLDLDELRARADAARAHALHTRDLRSACSIFRPERADHIALESGDAEQALALAELLEQGQSGGATVHFRLMYDDVPRHPTDLTWSSAVARLARAAAGIAPIRFSTETRAFAEALHRVSGQPVAVRPHPSALHLSAVPADRSRFVLLVPGEARSDKGRELVRSVVERLGRALSHRIVFRVQGLMAGENVERLADRLAPAAYADAWASCHAALLLHDPLVYRLRGSGTVCDAVAAGRPFVCLDGASLAEWAENGNAMASSADPNALIEAVERLVSHYDAFLAQTAAARELLMRLTEAQPWLPV